MTLQRNEIKKIGINKSDCEEKIIHLETSYKVQVRTSYENLKC